MREWHYFIDLEGTLWHDGSEFDDPKLLNFFMKNMESLPDGRFRVLCQGETCTIRCEDVPYVVRDLQFPILIFQGGYQERLDPATLFVGKGNVLYCKVRGGKMTARFNRRTYLEIAKKIQYNQSNKTYFLSVDNKEYPILRD